MSFRYDEAAAETYNEALQHTVLPNFKTPQDRQATKAFIDLMIERHGPIIHSYPDWHPLRVFAGNGPFKMEISTYVDHALYFRDAVLLAPYNNPPLDILAGLCESQHMLAREETGLYHNKNCKLFIIEAWGYTCEEGERYLSQKKAVAGLLDSWREPDGGGLRMPLREFTCWETWESMHRSLLGAPCGKRSSLFVDEKTGQAMKRLFGVMGQALGLEEYKRG